MSRVSRAGMLAAYRDGVTVICELAAQFTDATWLAATPCAEWRAVDLAGHLRCVADDYHEYLDDAPASRLARLMATGTPADSLARKLARQNSAELAALPDAPGRRAHRGVRRVRAVLRAAADAVLGPAAPQVPRDRRHGGRDGGRGVRRVAPARLGPGPIAGQGLPSRRPRAGPDRLAGRHAAAVAAARHRPGPTMTRGTSCWARRVVTPAGAECESPLLRDL